MAGTRDRCRIKAIIVGAKGVGKTKLMLREVEDQFSSGISTLGVDFRQKSYPDIIDSFGQPVAAQLWDYSSEREESQSFFDKMNSTHYRGAELIYLVYDATNEESFKYIQAILENNPEQVQKFQFVLIGNKTDLVAELVVETDRGKALADRYGLPFFEVSAKMATDVSKAFRKGLLDVIEKHAPKRVLPSPLAIEPSFANQVKNFFGELGRGFIAFITWPFRMIWRGLNGLFSSGAARMEERHPTSTTTQVQERLTPIGAAGAKRSRDQEARLRDARIKAEELVVMLREAEKHAEVVPQTRFEVVSSLRP